MRNSVLAFLAGWPIKCLDDVPPDVLELAHTNVGTGQGLGVQLFDFKLLVDSP